MKKSIFCLSLFLTSGLVFAGPPRTLPIPEVTPGAINPNITQDNIQTTICKVGFTGTIRPTNYFVRKLKKIQLATSYKSDDKKSANYEEDHLISLEIGGHPSDPKNLWPQPYSTKKFPTEWNARAKDQLENELKREVCSGKITLDTAQKAMANDWIAAYKVYVKK